MICLLGIALIALLILLTPRHARQAAELVRMPLDGRYRAPALVAMPEADGHILAAMASQPVRWLPTEWEPVRATGSAAGVELVLAGEAGYALVRSHHQHDLVTANRLGEEHLHVVVANDAPMTTFADLSGTRVGIGPAFSDTAMLSDWLVFGFRMNPPAETLAMPLIPMLNALDDGELSAALVLAPLHDPVMAELLADGEYRLLPIPQHEALSRSLPGVHASTIPAGSYGPNRSIPSLEMGDLPTISVDVLLAASPTAPYWQVWSLVRATHAPEFARAAPWHSASAPIGLLESNLPLHAATRDYLRRTEPEPAGRIERIGFVIAAMILLAATAAALRSRSHARLSAERRAAVVPYFESVEKLRHAMERAREAGDLRTVQNGLAQIQQQAEDEWLEGYLDTADMGNLYTAIAGNGARAARRQLRLELAQLREQVEQVQRNLLAAPRVAQESPKASPPPSRVKPPEIDDELEDDVPSILLEPGQDDEAKESRR